MKRKLMCLIVSMSIIMSANPFMVYAENSSNNSEEKEYLESHESISFDGLDLSVDKKEKFIS